MKKTQIEIDQIIDQHCAERLETMRLLSNRPTTINDIRSPRLRALLLRIQSGTQE